LWRREALIMAVEAKTFIDGKGATPVCESRMEMA
jgi:hypothetical protein